MDPSHALPEAEPFSVHVVAGLVGLHDVVAAHPGDGLTVSAAIVFVGDGGVVAGLIGLQGDASSTGETWDCESL